LEAEQLTIPAIEHWLDVINARAARKTAKRPLTLAKP
jgi:hypothetical protein